MRKFKPQQRQLSPARMSDDRFKYHTPTAEAVELHEATRHWIATMVQWMEENIPSCRERSVAITHLETAMFWANAGIAREISAKANE